MKKTRHFQLLLAAGLLALGQAGAQKPMTVADLAAWQRITRQAITDDGKWVAYKMEPWQGDATVYLHTADGTDGLPEDLELTVISYPEWYTLRESK